MVVLGVPEILNVISSPEHIEVGPVNEDTETVGLTVTVALPEREVLQPGAVL